MTRVLGIDLSLTRTGLGIIDYSTPGCRARVELVESTGKRADSLLDRDKRMHRITEEIASYVVESTELVAIEGPAISRAGGSSWDRLGLWWRVVHRLHWVGYRVVVVNPSTLKKWATGRGNADKSDVSVAMARLWPEVDSPSNDGWDGLALATCGAQQLGWPVPERAHHAASRTRIDWGDGKREVS